MAIRRGPLQRPDTPVRRLRRGRRRQVEVTERERTRRTEPPQEAQAATMGGDGPAFYSTGDGDAPQYHWHREDTYRDQYASESEEARKADEAGRGQNPA